MLIATLCEALLAQPADTNEHGNTIHRTHLSTERYVIDLADDFSSGGWQQFDTSEDAWYFGVWFCPKQLRTLSYCEGDWTLAVCADGKHYNAEVQSATDFYEEGFEFISVDDAFTDYATVTVVRQDRTQFLLPTDDECDTAHL